MERYIYSKKAIVNMAKREYTDEIKEIILLDTLYLQSKNARYYEKAVDLKWSVAVDMVDFWCYTPEHEEYYDLCDRIDFVLGNYIEEQSSKILENFLDNL